MHTFVQYVALAFGVSAVILTILVGIGFFRVRSRLYHAIATVLLSLSLTCAAALALMVHSWLFVHQPEDPDLFSVHHNLALMVCLLMFGSSGVSSVLLATVAWMQRKTERHLVSQISQVLTNSPEESHGMGKPGTPAHAGGGTNFSGRNSYAMQ